MVNSRDIAGNAEKDYEWGTPEIKLENDRKKNKNRESQR